MISRMDAIESTGALDYAYQQASAQVELARQNLEQLPDNEFRSVLTQILDKVVERRA